MGSMYYNWNNPEKSSTWKTNTLCGKSNQNIAQRVHEFQLDLPNYSYSIWKSHSPCEKFSPGDVISSGIVWLSTQLKDGASEMSENKIHVIHSAIASPPWLCNPHSLSTLRDGFKTQPAFDHRFRSILGGFFCSKQRQLPGTGWNHQSTTSWV